MQLQKSRLQKCAIKDRSKSYQVMQETNSQMRVQSVSYCFSSHHESNTKFGNERLIRNVSAFKVKLFVCAMRVAYRARMNTRTNFRKRR